MDPRRREGEAAPDDAREPPAPVEPGFLTTGDMARLSHSTLRTVRFYEEAGLLSPISRRGGGHRLFKPVALIKLQFILDLREAGLSLQDIRDLFELKRTAATPAEGARQMADMLGRQTESMHKRIATLRRLREELQSSVSALAECCACPHVEFPKTCTECGFGRRVDLPRAAQLLWKQ